MTRRGMNGHELKGTRELVHARWDDEDDLVAPESDDESFVVALVMLIAIVCVFLSVLIVLGVAVWGIIEILTHRI
jgi:hypothetical protein